MSVDTKNIRNVVLLGHSGSGKTSFAETMLYESGAIDRRGDVTSQNTISDFTQIEKDRGNSIFSTLMHANWKNSKINIIDTPGSDDFIGEVVSSLKVADTALITVHGASGVEVGTEIIGEYVNRYNTPAIFVVNHVDNDKSDYDTTVAQIQDRFGPSALPVQYPLNQGNGFDTIVDALRMTTYVFDEAGGKPKKEPIPESELNRAQHMHNALVEAAAENDETLMEKFFDAGSLNEQELAQGLTIALAKQELFPIFCCSATRNMGSGRIMGFINDIAPTPADTVAQSLMDGGVVKADSQGPASIFIYKTMSEPQVGKVSYFKVNSGTITSGDELINPVNSNHERLSQLYVAEGKNRKPVNELRAGDIGVTLKLKDTYTNDTLNVKGNKATIIPIAFPSSRFRTAVTPPSKSEMEKLMKALHQIEEEDPTLRIEQSKQLRQTILHGQGQLHLDIIKYRIEKVNGISMQFEQPKIPYRETITRSANESYRHKKQSGGSGQFGEVHMRIEPYHEGMPSPSGLNVRKEEIIDLPWGGKLAFNWCIVGGSIDSKYSNAIKKGILQKMEEGPLTGSYCQNIRVSVYDGKMHAVDSNDMAFQIAAAQCFKHAFKDTSPQILEPIYNLEVTCADSNMGDVMGDLQTRRAMIQGMDSDGHYQKIRAKVPLGELYKYSATLRSISQGKAKFTREFSEYAPVPYEIQNTLIDKYSNTEE